MADLWAFRNLGLLRASRPARPERTITARRTPSVVGDDGVCQTVAHIVGEGRSDHQHGRRRACNAKHYVVPPHAGTGILCALRRAQRRVMQAGRTVRLPDSISEEDAAGITLKGITAQYLLRRATGSSPAIRS